MKMESSDQIATFIKEIIAKEQKIDSSKIQASASFFELGLDSISAIYLMELVENEFQIKLTPLDFWDYPTIDSFSDYIFKANFQS